MNIMIINHYAGSEKYGMEFRPFYLGRELCRLGHEVTVIAADHSHLRIKNPIIEKSFTEEMVEGVRYVFVKTPAYEKNDVKRFANMISFLTQLKRNSRMLYERYLPEAVVASSTYPYDVKAAKRIASFGKNVRVCYEIHDIWPLSLIELYHLSSKNPYIRSLQRAELYAYKNADLVVSILPHVNRHIEELGFKDISYTHIPNGVIIDEAGKKEPPDFAVCEIERLRRQNKFILMYLGGFSKANALEALLESAGFMNENIQIVMVGGGPLWNELELEIKEKGIKNISLLPKVEKAAVNKTLELADALYIGAKRCGLYQYGVGMNKIFDYMLASRPIIYGIEASNDIVSDAHCGITIEPENPEEIASAAKRLYKMSKEELGVMGKSGYEYVCEQHDYKKLAKLFIAAVCENKSS